MDYTAYCEIMGIAFWVLAALATVVLIIIAFIRLEYYHWDKERKKIADVASLVGEIVDEKMNLGGGIDNPEN